MAKWLNWRAEIGLYPFIAVYALVNMALFQGPAWSYALGVTQTHNLAGIVTLFSFAVLQFFLFFFLLAGIALISVPLMKICAGALVVGNYVGLYFITSFKVELDESMMASILNTDPREAGGFTSGKLVVSAGMVAIGVALLLWRTRITAPRRHWRLLAWIAGTGAFLAYSYSVAFTLLWFDAYAQRLGGRLLPWSYVINTGRLISQRAFDHREITLLPDAAFTRPLPAGQKDVVVLVIGESARRGNHGIYGYGRDTTPMAQAAGMIPLQNAISCATYTIAAVSCMLSYQGAAAPPESHFEPLPSYLERNGVETIVRLNNTGTPPLTVTDLQWGKEVVKSCTANCPNSKMDDALLWHLPQRIAAAKSNRVFVVLHFTASHGPAYAQKYPAAFEHFTPVCTSVQLADCTPEALVNAYDNTILYTDSLLGQVISQLKSLPNTRAAMLYLSDHGESLGEAGIYLHGAPNVVAPAVQRAIPFMVWMSDSFQAAYGPITLPRDAAMGGGSADDLPFHSIMGAFGMTSPIYKPQFDLFAGQAAP